MCLKIWIISTCSCSGKWNRCVCDRALLGSSQAHKCLYIHKCMCKLALAKLRWNQWHRGFQFLNTCRHRWFFFDILPTSQFHYLPAVDIKVGIHKTLCLLEYTYSTSLRVAANSIYFLNLITLNLSLIVVFIQMWPVLLRCINGSLQCLFSWPAQGNPCNASSQQVQVLRYLFTTKQLLDI